MLREMFVEIHLVRSRRLPSIIHYEFTNFEFRAFLFDKLQII